MSAFGVIQKSHFERVTTVFGPKAVISHNASIARLYLGLLSSSAAEQVVLAAAREAGLDVTRFALSSLASATLALAMQSMGR